MTLMAAPPASTKTSLQQRLSAHARAQWPQLGGRDGSVPRRLRLRRRRLDGDTGRSSRTIYLASKDGYEDAVLPTGAFAGLPEDALDCAAGLYLGDPTG